MESESNSTQSQIGEKTVEISAPDVDKAVEIGLQRLGLAEDDALIEVLDEGSPGFLGIGGRDAVVKISSLSASASQTFSAPSSSKDASEKFAGKLEPLAESDVSFMEQFESDQPQEQEIAVDIINQLLEKMDLSADTKLRQTEPDDLTGDQRWVVDIRGEDLGLLIGSRGDTLNAFQYVARLMTGHQTHRRPNFLIDVEGYRERREQALYRLAERMADKAVKRGRVVTLEPMPPNERRIIHIALRQDDRVYTESIDEGQRRRVRIFPNKEG